MLTSEPSLGIIKENIFFRTYVCYFPKLEKVLNVDFLFSYIFSCLISAGAPVNMIIYLKIIFLK